MAKGSGSRCHCVQVLHKNVLRKESSDLDVGGGQLLSPQLLNNVAC